MAIVCNNCLFAKKISRQKFGKSGLGFGQKGIAYSSRSQPQAGNALPEAPPPDL
ncbi:hypothetical protein F7734_57460 [Scytonema sp. UIC 10036]|uniref:hypothetical protein n=1 Tax=Scytonema sp. UIC 10036 TaxID=2304196 RepID=UPI0012DADB48|nr:hypothetical protein [Scytonema sp. UIC 10036]MUH01356.1 hypothetical protein [Scytonema sp. UIC 10036]